MTRRYTREQALTDLLIGLGYIAVPLAIVFISALIHGIF